MVTYLALLMVRGAANRLFVFSNQHSSLSESVLTSLGMFGLAANGMCLGVLAPNLQEVLKCDPPAGR
jgi:hypothetical protein